MKRVFALSTALVSVLAVQAPAMGATVGVLMESKSPFYTQLREAFEERLAEKAPNVRVVVQTPKADKVARCNAARRFEALEVNAIATFGFQVTTMCVSEVAAVPVIYGVPHSGDFKLAAKNATGIEVTIPVLRVLQELKNVRAFSRLGVIFAAGEEAGKHEVAEVDRLQGQLSFKAVKIDIGVPKQLAQIGKVDAVLVTSSDAVQRRVKKIASLANKRSLPVAATLPGSEGKGVSVSVVPNPTELGHRAADMIAKILGGSKPGQLPKSSMDKLDLILDPAFKAKPAAPTEDKAPTSSDTE